MRADTPATTATTARTATIAHSSEAVAVVRVPAGEQLDPLAGDRRDDRQEALTEARTDSTQKRLRGLPGLVNPGRHAHHVPVDTALEKTPAGLRVIDYFMPPTPGVAMMANPRNFLAGAEMRGSPEPRISHGPAGLNRPAEDRPPRSARPPCALPSTSTPAANRAIRWSSQPSDVGAWITTQRSSTPR
jgi:hypothetical protein